MERDLLLPGTEDDNVKKEIGMDQFVKVEVRTARAVSDVSRGGGAVLTPLPDDAREDDIVELEFENDGKVWKQWMTVDEMRERIKAEQPSRGGEPLRLPQSWESKDASRGVGAIALKTLKIFGIDTADKFAEKGAQKIAAAIADKFESQVEKQGHPFGLYRFTNPSKIETKDFISDPKQIASSEPYLVFIHGTASSSTGSFGKLEGTDVWEQIKEKYGDRILALEHRTFSVSPIQNAMDMAALLPDGARLHLVSHSRGGLVGDLLCLADAGDCRAKFDALTQVFAQSAGSDKDLKAAREKQREDLKKLWDLLLKKGIRVERFVRVACPARGTTLASKRMDYFASGLLNAVGRIPVISANPIVDASYDWLKSLLLMLVKKKADPRELPGIEAMIPDSPLIEFLNHTDLMTQSDLGVIAGDIEVGDLKMTIPAMLGNAFFWAQNDLVVNTRSMSEGIRRANKAYWFFDQGSNVCHFNYFHNDVTRIKLREWLLRDEGEMIEQFREVQRTARTARSGAQSVADWLEQEEPSSAAGPEYTLKVSVLHGDLRRAAHPVAVGHYDGDGIVSAEKYIDTLLDDALSRRFEMRLYPGPVGTAEVILTPPGLPIKGAMVIGLGDVGNINLEAVRLGVATAALRRALAEIERPAENGGEPRSAAFSSLMIGTYGGHALSVKDSISAIIQGAMQANQILHERGLWDRVRIDEVEIVELYEDIAIQAVHVLHEMEEKPPIDFADRVKVKVDPPILKPGEGGRYQRPPSQFDAYWWRRIQITGAKKASQSGNGQMFAGTLPTLQLRSELENAELQYLDSLLAEASRSPEKRKLAAAYLHQFLSTNNRQEDDDGGGLEFLVLTDRARAEGTMQATERRKVDWLVKTAMRDTRSDKDLAVLLYELLVPNDLKTQAENVVLLVDREAARYPWELMTERSRLDEPLVTRIGLLRQFKTTDYRPNPQPSRGQNALVIGDPVGTGLVELKGAQQEATAVAKKLEDARYKVKTLIKKGGETILKELFAREYQILHIAAHGIFNAERPDQSGIVLEGGQLLTTREITNLRTVPDLVFINCCHLGEMERKIILSNEYPHRLAASVAEELIRMGVRTVVAAGWAVDDGAATTFADEFYKQMLTGECFGNAVLIARKKTCKEHRATNTWGAYQCYGNPGFRLNNQIGGRWGDGQGLYSRREYRDQLKSIAQMPDVERPDRNQKLRRQLVEMRKNISPQMLDGEVLTDFGDAWYALGDFNQTIRFYREAIEKEDAKVSIRGVERLANFECRYAEKLLRQTNPVSDNAKLSTRTKTPVKEEFDPNDLLREAERRLDWLLTLDKTPERLALKGRIYKTKALLASANKNERLAHLKTAKNFYKAGYDESNGTNFYLCLNLIACRLLINEKNGLDALLDACEQRARKDRERRDDFWTRVAVPDVALLRHLVKGDLKQKQNAMLKSYREAFATGPRMNEADTVLTQMDFLITMMKSEGTSTKERSLAASIEAIRDELRRIVQPQ
jgi:tetratricopeptide (TPR) repeat protein